MTNLNRRQLMTAAGAGALALPLGATAARAAAPAAGPEAAPGGAQPAYTSSYPSRPVTTGAESEAANGWKSLAGQKVGVITNPTGKLPVDIPVAGDPTTVLYPFGHGLTF